MNINTYLYLLVILVKLSTGKALTRQTIFTNSCLNDKSQQYRYLYFYQCKRENHRYEP
jgi:hypothetical protein